MIKPEVSADPPSATRSQQEVVWPSLKMGGRAPNNERSLLGYLESGLSRVAVRIGNSVTSFEPVLHGG